MKLPSLESLLATAMRAAVRRAVYELPKKWFIVFLIATIILSAIFGVRH